MNDGQDTVGADTWMTIQEDERGKEYIEAHLVEEAAPDGTVSDEISPFNVAYPLVPDEGGYNPAKFHVTIKQTEAIPEVTRKIGERISKFLARATVYKAGEWGYKMRLYDVENDVRIGSLQAAPSFDETDQLTEGDIIHLVVELKYDHEYTKDFTGFAESRLQSVRDEAEEWRESVRTDWEKNPD